MAISLIGPDERRRMRFFQNTLGVRMRPAGGTALDLLRVAADLERFDADIAHVRLFLFPEAFQVFGCMKIEASIPTMFSFIFTMALHQ